jgi:protocatechuate 3,4-dioxygenase beta subunit
MAPARIATAAGVAALSLALCGQAGAQKSVARAAPPPRIEGTVRDAAGKAIEKALVLARPATGDPAARTLSVRTDASGRFVLDVPRPGPYYLRVEAPGLAPHTVERQSVPAAALAVTLRKGGAIEGVVRDGRGKPVAGARVDARVGLRPGTLLAEPDAGRVRATTDAKGAFRLEGLATTGHSVIATAPGAGGARRDGVTPGARIELYLVSGASVRGIVRGPDRRPLAGASVLVEPDAYGGAGASVERTDAAGVFQVWGLRPGAWHAIAAHPDFAPAVAPVFLERNAEQRVELTLGAPARLRGRLVDAEERPVHGALALQEVEGQVVAQSLGQMLRAESDAQGRFTIERVPRAALALGVTAARFLSRRVEATPDSAELDLGDVVLDSGLAIRGRVRDQAGQAIADAQVRGGLMGMGPMRSRVEGSSAADGTFVLAGAEPGLYSLSVEAAGFATATTQASAGGEPIELTLERAGSITGTVVDEKGAPVAAFGVTATPVEEKGAWRAASGEGSEGRFELTDVAAGDWVLRVKATDKAQAHVPSVKVRTGAATDVGRIRLSPGATVRGRVTDSAGSPVAGAQVWTDTPGRFGSFTVLRGQRGTYTDASGGFELLGVEPGRMDVVADHPDFATGRLAGVDVDATRGATDLRVTLGRGGRIEGTARRRDGRPLERAMVRYMSPGPVSSGASAALTPDGAYVLEHVAAGSGRVSLSTSVSAGMSSTTLMKPVEVREGETAVVDFLLRDILVSGTVTRRGEPAAGVRITLRGMTGSMYSMASPGVVAATPTGPQYGFAVARSDGTYELLVTEPGPYLASVTSADGRINYSMRKVDVADADATTADLAFGGVAVPGQVVDAETSAPVAARIFAMPRAGEDRRPANTQGGPDGRFLLELEPGEFTVSASADGYAAAQSTVSVTESGASELRLALTRGLSISGRVVDALGRPVPSLMVGAFPEGDFPPGAVPVSRVAFGDAKADGTFILSGLGEGRYAVSAGDELAGFGVRPDVAAGSKDVVLRLAPGGRVRALVLRPDGSPAHPAVVNVSKVDGHQVMVSRAGGQTDANGAAEFSAPAGNLTVRAGDMELEGTASAAVSPGETATVEIRLAPRTKDPGTR